MFGHNQRIQHSRPLKASLLLVFGREQRDRDFGGFNLACISILQTQSHTRDKVHFVGFALVIVLHMRRYCFTFEKV